MTALEMPWHVRVRRALPGSALIISISICCTRRLRTPNFPRSSRGSNVCVQLAGFVPGACPTSQSPKWKICSIFHLGIAARLLYNLGDRSIEHDLLPWCERHGMPVMAYSTLGGLGASLLGDPILGRIAAAHACSAAAVALAWTMRGGNVIAIPESGSVAHVKENAVALSLALTPQELQTLDAAHPL